MVMLCVAAPDRLRATPDIDGLIVPEMLQVGDGVTLKAKAWDPPLNVAVIVAVAVVDTGATFAVKAAAVAPAETVTLAGSVTLVLLLDKETTAPAAGAPALSVA